MGLGSDLLQIVKDSVKLTDAVDRLTDTQSQLRDEVRDLDRRLVRLETMVEVAKAQAQLPGPGGQ
jgi:predicted  nucleic acid-binding Zn-ribbon protein